MSITFQAMSQNEKGTWVFVEGSPELRLSNANAYQLMRDLTQARLPNFGMDYSGHLSPVEMGLIKEAIDSHRSLYSFSNMQLPEREVAFKELIEWVEEHRKQDIYATIGWG